MPPKRTLDPYLCQKLYSYSKNYSAVARVLAGSGILSPRTGRAYSHVAIMKAVAYAEENPLEAEETSHLTVWPPAIYERDK